MKTSLATQLAVIAAHSSNPLDLKAQKKAHSQSLLFDRSIAASQDFNTIFQLCVEGFQELCQMEKKFLGFSRSIFSEQSKREDRSQMTLDQNRELDEVLESFLRLVGPKLLLKPALKAVEWLVRRFRVHESNTLCLVLTLLPYHTTPLFATMLSILPTNLPPTLKFLHPYVESYACPSRHTIVYAATHNQHFFSALNKHMIQSCRQGSQNHFITSHWATVVTEAVLGMIDQASTGRREAQRRKEEDLLHVILPILNEGLSMSEAPDLRVGCYMIVTVLASKLSLEDKVLDAIMVAVISNWTTDTTHAALTCLAVLAQRKQATSLPKEVSDAVTSLADFSAAIQIVAERYQSDRFIFGLVQGTIDRLGQGQDNKFLAFVRSAIEGKIMDSAHRSSAITLLLSAVGDTKKLKKRDPETQGRLSDLILTLADSKTVGGTVQDIIKNQKVNREQLEMILQTVIPLEDDEAFIPPEDVVMEDDLQQRETFDASIRRIPTRTAYEISFLSHSKSYVFDSLSRAFLLATLSSKDLKTISEHPVLRRSLVMTEPLFMSFFIRLWCGPYPSYARSAAVNCVRECVEEAKYATDMQIVFPYILYALGDSSSKVRQAATSLILTLASAYEKSNQVDTNTDGRATLGNDSIYGAGPETKAVQWFTEADGCKFVTELLLPNLEECRLDASFISQLLADSLNGLSRVKAGNTARKDFKTTFRVAILTTISSHVNNTPLYAVKYRLMAMLNKVGKVGSISRTRALLPILAHQKTLSEESIKTSCKDAKIDPDLFIYEVMNIVSPNDREGLRMLQHLVCPERLSPPMALRKAAFARVREIWKPMKSDMQLSLAEALLYLAFGDGSRSERDQVQVEAIETLRAVHLTANILQHALDKVNDLLVNTSREGSPTSKRRRLSNGHAQGQAVLPADTLRQITFVFELIDSSSTGTNSGLLNPIFKLFADIQHIKNQSGVEMGYLQSLILGCLNSIIKTAKATPSVSLDRSAIRADLVIDCLRTTTNAQVQQSALLLMSSLASVVPEVIIHSVMPVFTFMGATVLRQTDEYSAHVIDQTIESVIPPLVLALRKQKGGPLAGSSELLLSFVAAFEHVPQHRRMGLFSSLVDKLGPDDSLFALLVMLLDRHAGDRDVAKFVVDLAGQYNALTQIKTMERYLEVVLDSLKPKPTFSSHLLTFGDGRTPASTALTLLPIPAQIFRAPRLISKVAKVLRIGDQETLEVRKLYSQLIEQTLRLAEQLQPYENLPVICDGMLDALLSLLSMQESIKALETLLENGSNQIRRQVLRSLENRINSAKTGDSQTQNACVDFLPRLISILESAEDPLLKHSAVACIDKITEKYGKRDVEKFGAAIRVLSGDHCLGSSDPRLRVMTVLCLATAVEVLGEATIPIIPKALPKSIDHLKLSIREDQEDERLHDAVYSFVGALLSYIPWLVTGQYLDLFLKASHESANSGLPDKCEKIRKAVLNLVAKQVNAQECFAALDRTWNSAMVEGPQAVSEHLEILQLSIERQSKSLIVKQAPILHSLFLKVFDTRRIQFCPRTEDSYEDDEIEVVEHKVNEVAIKMIYKLNDASFRPLFVKMQEWASASGTQKQKQGKIFRQTTWYTFLHTFFDTLKSIVTSYASYIIDDTVTILQSLHPSDPDSLLLFNRVLTTLSSSFEHDQDDFWQSHFPTISPPLIATFPLLPTSPLLPNTITGLAATANSPAHQKSLNTTLLSHMRSDNAAVRLAAVVCQRALTKRLGEEWLVLLPEMLPFMSEAMEDGNEDVENEVRAWVGEVEGVLGESLEGMLA